MRKPSSLLPHWWNQEIEHELADLIADGASLRDIDARTYAICLDHGAGPATADFVRSHVSGLIHEYRIARNRKDREETKPEPGAYWASNVFSRPPEKVIVERGKSGGVIFVINGTPHRATWHQRDREWKVKGVSHRNLYASPEAAANPPPPAAWVPLIKVRLLSDKTDDELRRMRSENHPDKNPGADLLLYQRAVQELDARRNEKGR